MSILELDLIAQESGEFIADTVPGVCTVSKYGGTLYTLRPDLKEGQFCGVFVYNNHVQISFSRGALLDDPKGILSGQGKLRRHLNYRLMEELDLEYIAELLVQASRMCESD